MKLTPLEDQVIVRPEKGNEKTDGGIYLPDNHVAKQWMLKRVGTVIAVGPGAKLENGKRAKPAVKRGDKVIFTQMSEGHVIDDETLVFAKGEKDILAVLEG